MGIFSIFRKSKKDKIKKCYEIKNPLRRVNCYKNINYKFEELKDVEITPLHNNIFEYLERLKMLAEFDYNERLDKFTIGKLEKKKVLIEDFVTDEEGDVHLYIDQYFKEMLKYYGFIYEIYTLIISDIKIPRNQFNSNILNRYIINMDEVMASINKSLTSLRS
jgi:hypothetical protein